MKKILAVFDFDGTLTVKDTLLELIKYQKGTFLFWLGFLKLSPIVLFHLLKIIPNWKAKELVLSHFFKGEVITDFQLKCDEFSRSCIPKILRAEALAKFQKHAESGHEIVVISASAENWLTGWCKEQGVKLIATKLEVKTDKITGKLVGNNCYGSEKLNRLRKELNLEDFEEIHVYGDSKGDKEILEIASHAFYRKF